MKYMIASDIHGSAYYCKKMIALEAKPNSAHFKLAELEQKGKLSAIITQNIDGLHQAAGSKNVFELHGSVHRNFCLNCNSFYDASFILEQHKIDSDGIPHCTKCNHIVKPDVVLYEEGLDQQTLQNAVKAIQEADMLIIGGTSLAVYPAAGLIDYYQGNKLVLINKTPTSRDSMADLVITDSIGEVFSKII